MALTSLEHLTVEVLKAAIIEQPASYGDAMLRSLIFGPRYQHVTYRAASGKVYYENPNHFYGLGPRSPSDCRWMIPCGLEALEQEKF